MPRHKCPSEENVLRAIHSAHWDESKNFKSSAIFKGQNISVSRLAILGLPELFAIFQRQLGSSPNGAIIAGGEINIGRLQEIGRSYLHNPTELSVEEDPIDTNPAHAVIPQKIRRGLAREIIKALIIHRNPLIHQP